MTDELKPRNQHLVTHGHARKDNESPTYVSWQSMLARCRYSNRNNSARYIERGISVCIAWKSFDNFLKDMGERPDGKTLDRIDNDKGYCKDNCRWATKTEQARNTRRNKLTFEDAVCICIAMMNGQKAIDVARKYGCSESLPREIMRGRCWKDALHLARSLNTTATFAKGVR